jgi:hypothetical protein
MVYSKEKSLYGVDAIFMRMRAITASIGSLQAPA